MIAKGSMLQFIAPGGGLRIVDPRNPNEDLTIHKHAFGQIADRAKVKNFRNFAMELNGRPEWGQELLAHNLNQIFGHGNGDRYLLREVNGQLRGFLSDQYRRLDSRPLLDAFIGAITKFGARPADGFALETKVKIRAYLPYIFEPFPGELIAYGAELSDSDYGDGFLTLCAFAERMWCTNLATSFDVLKQVHLGKRLPDNLALSAHTLELDTQTMASALNDLSGAVLGPGAVNEHMAMIRRANESAVEPAAVNAWIKKNLGKEEGAKMLGQWQAADLETLPQGQTSWRFSNAVSWLARETADEHRRLELQDMAGNIIAEAVA